MKTEKRPGRAYLQPEAEWESALLQLLVDGYDADADLLVWWTDDAGDVDGLDNPLTTDAHRALVVSDAGEDLETDGGPRIDWSNVDLRIGDVEHE